MRTQSLLLLLLTVFLFLSHGAVAKGGAGKPQLAGGWKPIKDIKDPDVQGLGAFAVSEYNKQAGTGKLAFLQVVSGEQQVVSGINSRLVLNAKDGAATHSYVAVVYEQAWKHYRNLTSFKLKA